MPTPEPIRKISGEYLAKALSYEAYKQLITDLLARGQSTNPQPSEALTHYSQLNLQRMHRLDKTTEISPEIRQQLAQPVRPQTWLVLTEGWCGDAAQSIPVMEALARLNPDITLRYLLRDQNLELMDQHLTNGVSRSIPKLIAVDKANGEELFSWGPRPAALQELFYKMKADGMPFDNIKEELQRWYNKDKTQSIQQELATLVASLRQPLP